MRAVGRSGARIGALLLAAWAAAACSTFGAGKRAEDFEECHKRFASYVRWGKIDKASLWVTPDQRVEFLSLAPDLTLLRFTDYEILEVDLDDDARTATVEVRYSGYLANQPIERSIDVLQEWSQDEATGEWLVRLDIARLRNGLSGATP